MLGILTSCPPSSSINPQSWAGWSAASHRLPCSFVFYRLHGAAVLGLGYGVRYGSITESTPPLSEKG
jgi:hypothetical protein